MGPSSVYPVYHGKTQARLNLIKLEAAPLGRKIFQYGPIPNSIQLPLPIETDLLIETPNGIVNSLPEEAFQLYDH